VHWRHTTPTPRKRGDRSDRKLGYEEEKQGRMLRTSTPYGLGVADLLTPSWKMGNPYGKTYTPTRSVATGHRIPLGRVWARHIYSCLACSSFFPFTFFSVFFSVFGFVYIFSDSKILISKNCLDYKIFK
jgi:hypothetical protein